MSVKKIKNKAHGGVSKLSQHCTGFTLLELMIVVAIIGILASVALSSYQSFITRSILTETATQFSQYARAFQTWEQIHGRYPSDASVGNLPADGNGLGISLAQWQTTTAIGGNWNWEGAENHAYTGISIEGATSPEEDVIELDMILDNGDLTSGKFRKTPNGRYTYILDE